MVNILRNLAIAPIAILAFLVLGTAHAGEQIGVLMLHGKSPGNPHDPNFSVLKASFEQANMLVTLPDMPWSRNRYIDGNWDQAMDEISAHVKTLRDRGATKIVLIGHSMGVPASVSFAARKGDVQGMVLLAPGHAPFLYYTYPNLRPVHDSIDAARALSAAGKGDASERFTDINQGKAQVVVMTARNYLSYFDPESDAEMSVTAPRVPPETPSLVVVGDQDPLFFLLKSYFFDKLPPNPKTRYLEVKANHLTTPRVALDTILEWIKTSVGE